MIFQNPKPPLTDLNATDIVRQQKKNVRPATIVSQHALERNWKDVLLLSSNFTKSIITFAKQRTTV